jgi:hypothetical protein
MPNAYVRIRTRRPPELGRRLTGECTLYFGSFRRANRRFGPERLRLTLFAILALVVGPAFAQQSSGVPSYEVELVIFQHLAGGASEEVWDLEQSLSEPLAIPDEDASPFETSPPAASAVATQTFPPLPASRLKLTAIEEQLRRSRNYRPIAHIGWTQPGYARNAAPFIPVDSLVSGASGLSGRIALSRGRYLHLTLDLTLMGQDGQRYTLRQSRRMRSTERHYIDHPKFGVIALITPTAANAP